MTTTGNSYASFLLGALNSSNVTEDSVVGTGARYGNYSYWIQDNFKVSSRLMLNLGLRHDIFLPFKEVLDRESFFNPNLPNSAAGGAPGILMFMGNGPNSCKCRTNINTNYKNFGPRIGVAYTLNDKTVIRAGYTIMYTHRGAVGGRGGGRIGTGTLGYSASPSFVSPEGYSPAFYWDNGVPSYAKPPFFEPTLGTTFNGTTSPAATMQYGDPIIGGRPPRYQNWNLGVQRALTSTLSLSVNYVGSNGHFLGGGGRGFWSDQVHPRYLVLGNLLTMPANSANLATARNILPSLPGLPYPNYSGTGATIGQMLRSFPQYTNVSDLWGDVANSNYNSLQLTANKRLSHGLVFNLYYTYAKAMDDTAGTRTAYNWKTEKAPSTDAANVLNILWVYGLPFGKGHSLGSGNVVVEKLTSNWQLSGITTYRSGQFLGTVGAACTLPPNAGSCYADYNPNFSGPIRINGTYGSGDLLATNAPAFLDRGAWMSPTAYSYGNTPRTGANGLRGPSNSNQSVALKRDFGIREGWKISVQADAFNVFNWVRFGNPNFNITSANFGKITGTANSPRVVQFNARLTF
ncbi:MAG: hypothetical protein HYZ37_07940 [Candidatus Solibacter usitatus]|nr:hypothetical protein [Candidatus Solibacter usitatus]